MEGRDLLAEIKGQGRRGAGGTGAEPGAYARPEVGASQRRSAGEAGTSQRGGGGGGGGGTPAAAADVGSVEVVVDGGGRRGGGAGAEGGEGAPAAERPRPPPERNELTAFFEEASSIRAGITQMRKHLHVLQETHDRTKVETMPGVVKSLREKMRDDVDATNRQALELKLRIEAVEKENEVEKGKEGKGEGTSDQRTRAAMTLSLQLKLRDTLEEFNALRDTIHAEYKEVVSRRYRTVNNEAPDEAEVERLIRTGESEAMFKQAILEKGRGETLATVMEIQERHEAIKELERSLLELNSIFLDMAVLVEAQGEVLNNIDYQVSKSVEYTQKGTKTLGEVKEMQKQYRRVSSAGRSARNVPSVGNDVNVRGQRRFVLQARSP